MFLGRVVAPGEPLFLPRDSAEVLAFLRWEAERCSGCGFPLHQTTDPDYPFVYVPSDVVCIACEERGLHEDRLRKDAKSKPQHGVYVVLDEQPLEDQPINDQSGEELSGG